MAGVVMLFVSFVQLIFGMLGRMPYMFYFGILLLVSSFFCFEDSRKIFRGIVAVLCAAYAGFCVYQSMLYGIDYHYYTLNAVTEGLLCIFLCVSMLSEKEEETEEENQEE